MIEVSGIPLSLDAMLPEKRGFTEKKRLLAPLVYRQLN